MFVQSLPKLNVMAKSSTRRVTIYINGKEVEASVKQIRSEMNKLVNEQNRMVIGSDEYISHAKKIKELRQYLKEHAQNIGSGGFVQILQIPKIFYFALTNFAGIIFLVTTKSLSKSRKPALSKSMALSFLKFLFV